MLPRPVPVGQGEGVLALPRSVLCVKHHILLIQHRVHPAGFIPAELPDPRVEIGQARHLEDGVVPLHICGQTPGDVQHRDLLDAAVSAPVQPVGGHILELDAVPGKGDGGGKELLVAIMIGLPVQGVGVPVIVRRHAHHVALLDRQRRRQLILALGQRLAGQWGPILQGDGGLAPKQGAVCVLQHEAYLQLVLVCLLPGKLRHRGRRLQHLHLDGMPLFHRELFPVFQGQRLDGQGLYPRHVRCLQGQLIAALAQGCQVILHAVHLGPDRR